METERRILKNDTNPMGLHIFSQVYRLLLKIYPGEFQREYGEQLSIIFRDCYTKAWNSNKMIGVVGLWCWLIIDLLRNAVPAQISHLAGSLEEVSMFRKSFSRLAQISSVVVMLVAAGVAALLWAQLGLNGIFKNGIQQGIWFIILFDGAIAVVGVLCLVLWKSLARLIFD